ncbi:hypothetical protein [Mesorhizobium caraganae]|uniref:hypothetical protein n=1 Tax=Mesorhizobium caraganae TaxID=483206 RepID=UPI0017808275|nr:hypothetical protein [Mesorhizobium caraganae]
MKLIALEVAKGSDLTSRQPIAACVTNPFMVTGAFTIFLGLEPFFIRILAVVGQRAAVCGPNLDFCAAHNILSCIAQRRSGKGASKPSRET